MSVVLYTMPSLFPVTLTLTLALKYFSSRQCVLFGDNLCCALYNVLSISSDPHPDAGTEVFLVPSVRPDGRDPVCDILHPHQSGRTSVLPGVLLWRYLWQVSYTCVIN